MHAVWFSGPGGPEVLHWSEYADPSPGPGEVVLATHATGVNFADLLQRQGLYPPPAGASPILGLECAGIITALGPDVTSWSVGDRVCTLVAGGAYAEKVVAPADQLLPVPGDLSLLEAAAVTEAACTVYSNLGMKEPLTAGMSVLIQGGGSGALRLVQPPDVADEVVDAVRVRGQPPLHRRHARIGRRPRRLRRLLRRREENQRREVDVVFGLGV